MTPIKRHVKRLLIESFAWLLVAAGIAAIVLPGPGLLMLFAGLALLATRYEWAERRLEPVRRAALRAAADGVKTWPRILLSTTFAFLIMAVGIIWGLRPDAPPWWPLADKYWLLGGWGTGITLILSGGIAVALIIYSYARLLD